MGITVITDTCKGIVIFVIVSLIITVISLSICLAESDAKLALSSEQITEPTSLSTIPIIQSFSGEVELGSINNLLMYNNPDCSSIWNSASNGHIGNIPSWVVFDFVTTITMTQFQFANAGDITHDATFSTLSHALSPFEDWTLFLNISSDYDVSTLQSFVVPNITSRYFKWQIDNTASGYQAYIRCVNFTTIPYTGACCPCGPAKKRDSQCCPCS
jgi:hypothetical protein